MHVDYCLYMSDLPEDCIRDCSASGDVTGAVEAWVEELDFTVDRERAIQTLQGYGAWSLGELNDADDELLAQRILWLACGDFSEFQSWQADNPDKEPHEADYGSDVFVLE